MQLEAGKKYTDRRGRVYGPMIQTGLWFGEVEGQRCWPGNGLVGCGGDPRPIDLIAEYVEPAPVESPDDWVEITDPNHVLRDTNELTSSGNIDRGDTIQSGSGWILCRNLRLTGETVSSNKWARARCRSKDLPPVKPVVDPGEGYRLLGDDEITLATDERAYAGCDEIEWLALPSANPKMVGKNPAELRNSHGSDIVIRRKIETVKPAET
jgi:hypothetical protein